jgi:hypothetical protein
MVVAGLDPAATGKARNSKGVKHLKARSIESHPGSPREKSTAPVGERFGER